MYPFARIRCLGLACTLACTLTGLACDPDDAAPLAPDLSAAELDASVEPAQVGLGAFGGSSPSDKPKDAGKAGDAKVEAGAAAKGDAGITANDASLLDAGATATPALAPLDAASLDLIDVGTLTPGSFDAGTAPGIQDSATASDAKPEGG